MPMTVHVHFNDKQYAKLMARAEAEGLKMSQIVKSAILVIMQMDKPRYKVHIPKAMLRPIVPPETPNANI